MAVYHHAAHLQKEGNEIIIIYIENIPGRDKNILQDFFLNSVNFEEAKKKNIVFDVIFATWWETVYDVFHFKSRYYFYFVQDDERRFYEDKESYNLKFCNLTYCNPGLGIITVSGWLQKMLWSESNINSKLAPYGYDPAIFNPAKRAQPNKKLRVLVEGPGAVWFKRVDDCFVALNEIEDIEVWFVSRDNFVSPGWKIDKYFVNVRSIELSEIYTSCDVLLKMSEVESFCLPNLEMMASGGTIVTTDFTGHLEYAIDGFNSIVIPIRGVENARLAIIRLRDDRELLAQLQHNALITAAKMTWKQGNKKFELALAELIEEFKDYDYTAIRKTFLQLDDIKLNTNILITTYNKLHTDYKDIFDSHHQNEYRALRLIARPVRRIMTFLFSKK